MFNQLRLNAWSSGVRSKLSLPLRVELWNGQRLDFSPEPPRVTIREKIEFITKTMNEMGRSTFRGLLNRGASRLEIVVTFLAMLELVKRYRLQAHQETLFSDIELDRAEDWKEDEEIEIEFE